jgi:P27 family predicted phage terminase small subunit
MTQGRRPLPTVVKELAGNPGKRALNKAEPKPARFRRVPQAPDFLTGLARKKWKELAAKMHRIGMLTEVDLDTLACYCIVYARWRAMEKKLEKQGEVILTSNNNPIQNPYLAIANRSLEQMNKLAAEMGITPSSRSRVKAVPPSEEQSKKLEEEFFGKRVKVTK